jgi:hypothetical protein
MADTARRSGAEQHKRYSKDSAARVMPFPGGNGPDRDEVNPPAPDNIPATEAVLGHLLIQRNATQQRLMCEEIAEILQPADIKEEVLRKIYIGIGQLSTSARLEEPSVSPAAFVLFA